MGWQRIWQVQVLREVLDQRHIRPYRHGVGARWESRLLLKRFVPPRRNKAQIGVQKQC